jgi:hypothetical protein
MSLRLYELATDANEADFRPITDLESEAFQNPFFGFWQVFNGPTPDELCARQLAWHKEDSTSRWFYVKDEKTGDVVGGAQWNIYEQNPYAKETTMLTPYWQPEGTFTTNAVCGIFTKLIISTCRYIERYKGPTSSQVLILPSDADE